MNEYYFSFGSNHRTADGSSLGNFYVVIQTDTEDEARDLMVKTRGLKWCTSYPTADKIGVDRYNLRQIPLEDVWLPENDR